MFTLYNFAKELFDVLVMLFSCAKALLQKREANSKATQIFFTGYY